MEARTVGPYEIQEPLGAGAWGTVYRAFDTHLHRTVVVKVLHADGRDAGDLGARLMEEARLASAIDHPNVCAVYDAGVVDGQPYLVMQHVPGRTLAELLRDGPLSEPLALSIGVQVAAGLAAAHRHGVLHRDLKPSNVMVTDEGLAKILDFGLARRTSPGPDPEGLEAPRPARRAASSRFGTTAYMAPEQFVTRRSTEQSDVWALGVVLFEMVTGRHPFRTPGADAHRLAHDIQFVPAPDPEALRPGLDPALADVVRKALAKQPEDRTRSAAEVREALRTLKRALDPDLSEPGEAPVPLPPRPDAPPRGGLLTQIADRLIPPRPPAPPAHAVAVLPFEDESAEPGPPYVGFALADAVATRLASAPGLLVRPPRTLRTAAEAPADPVEAGRRLVAGHVLTGRFTPTDGGYLVTWSLLSTQTDAVVVGEATALEAADLVTAQERLGEAVYAALEASGALPIEARPRLRPAAALAALSDDLAEDYLAARARLDGQARRSSPTADLQAARRAFEALVVAAPDAAAAHAGLGVALVRLVRLGAEGEAGVIEAFRHLDRALQLDPAHIEARVYRAYPLMWQGETTRARGDIQYLLRTVDDDAEVFVGAGVALQLDGLLDAALRALGTALRLNPSIGPRVYVLRARCRMFMGDEAGARAELDRGLGLEPGHTLLRAADAAWHLRYGDPAEALAGLEAVRADDPELRAALPALAVARLRAGDEAGARALLSDDVLATAAADCEQAYRVATVHAALAEPEPALHWLRKAVYLGNHDAPWFWANPAWAPVRDHAEIRQTLDEVASTHADLRKRWARAAPDLVD